jgi:hypothetical protein
MSTKHDIVVGLLLHDEIGKFQEFIREHWDKNHLFAKETRVFDWQHKSPTNYHYVVAKIEEEIVGIHGLIPLKHFDKNLPAPQIFLTIWKALEDRSLGLGLRLFKACEKEYSPEFIGTLGLDDKLIPFHKWQGFTTGLMDHHVMLSPDIGEFKIAIVPDYIKPKRQENDRIVSGGQEIKKLTISKLNALNTNILYSYQRPLKSDGYIENRYLRHPIYDYDVYAILEQSEPIALCVVRLISENGTNVLRFVDYIGSNESFSKLQSFSATLLKKYDAEYIDIYSHGISPEILKAAGYIRRSIYDDLVVPNHFEPFHQNNINLNFGYKCPQIGKPVRLFKGDCDQDQPRKS